MTPKIVLYYNDLVFQPSETFLFKDFGQVPFTLADLHGADLEYWIAAVTTNPALNSFRGRRVRQFAKSFAALPGRLDVLRNARLYRDIGKVDGLTHLIIFPFTPLTDLMVARRAKRAHPGLKIIVKLDTNQDYLYLMAADWQRFGSGPRKWLRQSCHYRELLRMADLLICETDDCRDILSDGFLGLNLTEKLAQTYSGLSETWLASIGIDDAALPSRRNSIVVSGRISSRQKYTRLILEAGPPPAGWTIDFIGAVDANLAGVIAEFRAADPQFDQHYRFHGAVYDKRAYFDILRQARALLMNSRGGEGFPNVFAEAHFCRLYIVTSDVSGAREATGGGQWGMVVAREDAVALRAALLQLPERIAERENNPIPESLRQRFIWEHSLDQPAIRRQFALSSQAHQV